MPKKGTHENKAERQVKYREWLVKRPQLYRGRWPRDDEAVRREIVIAMKKDGTLAQTTYWKDVKLIPILDSLCGLENRNA